MDERKGKIEEPPEPEGSREMSLIGHLEEFRTRLLRSLICLAILLPVGFYVAVPMIDWMRRLCPEVGKLYYLRPMALFIIQLKVGFYLSALFCFPFLAYQAWQFVAPALFKKEQRFVTTFAFISSVLFLAGAAMALLLVFPAVMRFSAGMSTEGIQPMIEVESFVGLAGMLMLGFGVVFQTPILVWTLARYGIVSVGAMANARPYVYVGAFILASVLTPGPDVISQLCMGGPTILFFELGLIVARWSIGKKAEEEAEEEE